MSQWCRILDGVTFTVTKLVSEWCRILGGVTFTVTKFVSQWCRILGGITYMGGTPFYWLATEEGIPMMSYEHLIGWSLGRKMLMIMESEKKKEKTPEWLLKLWRSLTRSLKKTRSEFFSFGGLQRRAKKQTS